MKISDVRAGQLYSSPNGYFLAIAPHLNNKSELYSCEGIYYDNVDQRTMKSYMDNTSEYKASNDYNYLDKKETIECIFIYNW
jgi:hypothetical protein